MSLGKFSHLKVQTSTVKKFHLGIKIKDKLEDEVPLLNRVDFFLGILQKRPKMVTKNFKKRTVEIKFADPVLDPHGSA
jgi:hypothetical protein